MGAGMIEQFSKTQVTATVQVQEGLPLASSKYMYSVLPHVAKTAPQSTFNLVLKSAALSFTEK